MNSQHLFWFNIIVGLLFVIYFLTARKSGKKPTQLNLRAAESEPIATEPVPSKPAIVKSDYAQKHGQWLNPEALTPTKPPPKERALNVFFMYNGHDWDAFQVLEIPAGSTIPLVTQIYQERLKKADPSTHLFLEAAYKAIMDAYTGRKL